MNLIEEQIMYLKSHGCDKDYCYSEYFDCILTEREFDRIFDDEGLYKEFLNQ